MLRRLVVCVLFGGWLTALGCSSDESSTPPATTGGSAGAAGASGQVGADAAAGQGGGSDASQGGTGGGVAQGGGGNSAGQGGTVEQGGAAGAANSAGAAGTGGSQVDSGGFWPGEFDGGCFDITNATVNDTCLNEAANIPNNPPISLLDRINKRRTAVGKTALSNPVDLSAEFEKGLQSLLVDKYPPFPLDPIDSTDLADGQIQVQVPNVYGVHPDENGDIPQEEMITLSCQVVGNVGTCAVTNVQLDITDILLDALAGGDVDTPAALSCIVTVGGTVTVTWVSNQEVHYLFNYQLAVVEAQCNATIQDFFKKGACAQTYDLTVKELGPIAESGPPCAAY